MALDKLPVWIIFAATILIVVVMTEIGLWLGRAAFRRSLDEKESSVSAIQTAVLGLLAFMLAFTFGIVSDRYEARKSLVRDEANAIRTAWLRSDFLPESQRNETRKLFMDYINLRLTAVQSGNIQEVQKAIGESVKMQDRLWEIAAKNAGNEMNSDVAALYIESLNEVINYHALRVNVGFQMRLPGGIWLVLYVIIILSMILVGYHSGISASGRSWTKLVLALSFSLVIALILALDRPDSSHLSVSQQPLITLHEWMITKK
jgi:hypothetical protein